MNKCLHLPGALMIAMALAGSGNTAHAVGAATPFVSYEAEAGTLAGGASVVAVTSPVTSEYSSAQLEASGHAYVQLTATGQSVTWTNTSGQSFTALNLRSCIPDAPTGGGISNTINLYINGQYRQSFAVNSMQNYCYETSTNYNDQTDKIPTAGSNPRGFWNDTHAFIVGNALMPGDTITFQRDLTNNATFYYIDVIDLETPVQFAPPPAGTYLSITNSPYNAVANNSTVDNTTAINNCFKDALTQGKIAWIPPGTYYFSAIHGGLNASGITIAGAGPWYSAFYRFTPVNNNQGVANIITTTSCTISNLLLDCNGFSRAGNNNNGAVNSSGNNWVVDNVWIEHVTSSFWCAGVNGIARNCRTMSVWSDGGNFNNVQSANGIGMNLTYSNNFVRGTGDDAMAINSVNYNVNGSTTTYYTTMSNITYINNTAVSPWGGKGIGIYGGYNIVVTNNLLQDTARYLGLGVGKFGVNGSGLMSATVMGNTVLRCGGNGYSQRQPAMMIGNGGDGQSVGTVANAYCASNTIINAMYSAVQFTTSTNMVFQRNTIINSSSNGIVIASGVTGTAIINSNSITGLNPGTSALVNSASGYVAIIPVAATRYFSMSGVTTETCTEGGQDVSNITNGDWTAYSSINLTGANTFVARVASGAAGGSIQIHLDSPSGTLVGTCSVPGTGDWQKYANAYCNLTAATGLHSLYLVYNGGDGNLFNMEFFGIFAAPPATSHQLVPGNTYSLLALVNGKYVTAPNGGASSLIASSTSVGTAESFKIIDAGGGNIGFLALINNSNVTAESDGTAPLIANRPSVGSWETFTEYTAGNGNIALLADNDGDYVTAPNGGASPLIASSTSIGTAESFTVGFVNGVLPSTPANLIASAGNGQATLTWVASQSATSYNVKRSLTSGGSYATVVTNVTALGYTDTNLANAATYYYVVSAQNPIGEGTNSSQASVVPGSLSRTLWAAISSTSGSDSPGNALDGNLTTRWSTGAQQTPGQWFQLDMGAPNVFNELILNCINSANDYPRGYIVTVSNDGVNWSSSVAAGSGSPSLTTITFPTQVERYIRITQTNSASGTFWSIDEINVMGAAPLAPIGLTATNVSSTQINLAWNATAGASGFDLKRSTTSGTGYATIATNLPYLSYSDGGLASGAAYYYVVSATNIYGESGNSIEASARPVSTNLVPVNVVSDGSQIQMSWPMDHTGWHVQIQTNSLDGGIGTNWVNVPNSNQTNLFSAPINVTNGSVYLRLAYP